MLIVGAGPAGTALAWQLSRQSIPVTLVEASRHGERPFRGQGLMPSGVAALAELGLDPLPAAVPQRALRGWSFVLDSRPVFSVAEPMGSAAPCQLIDTGALLRHWHERLRQRGVRWLAGQAAVALLEEGKRVCGVGLADGTRLRAELVVGSDGRASTLRRLAGLPLQAKPEALELLWFRLGAAAGRPVETWLADRFVTLVGASGSGALFRRAEGGVQIGWVGEAPPDGDWREAWAAAAPPDLAERLRALPQRAMRGPLRLAVSVGLAPCWHRPGLLLLGDAAHPMSPLRAQGLNMALRDAVVAARHIAPALMDAEEEARAAAVATALARIEAERLPELRAVQALQAEEAARAQLLRHQPWLRALLARTAPLSGPLLARRWVASQRVLRDGLTPLTATERR